MRSKITNWAQIHPARAATVAGWYQQLCSAGAALLIIPVLINSLGIEVAGIWFSLQGIIAIFTLSDFGFSMAITRQVAHSFYAAHDVDHLPSDLIKMSSGWKGAAAIYAASRTIFMRVMFASILLFIIAYELVLPHTNLLPNPTTETTLVWYLLAVSFALIFQARLSQAFLDGLGYMYLSRVIAGTYQLICGLFSILSLWMGFGLTGLAVVLLAGSFVQFSAMHISLSKVAAGELISNPEDSRPLIGKLCKVAIPFGLVSAGGYLVGAVQVPLLGALLGPTVIASIYIALKISQILNGGVLQVVTAQMPLFTKQCAQGDWTGARLRMFKTLVLGAGLQILVAIFLYFISPVLVKLWIGPGHYIEGVVLLVFTINYLITCLAGLPAQFVLASGRNPFALSTILHGILTLSGMVLFCPQLGLLGVPLAGIVGVILTNFWLNPMEAWGTWQSLKRTDNLAIQP